MIQWFLDQTVRFAEYAQGVGAAGKLNHKTDSAVLRQLRAANHPLVIFDVGANHGDYSQLALETLKGNVLSIHAFEPSSAAFTALAQRYVGNANVILNNFALGSAPSERTLYFDKPGSELSSLYSRSIGHHGIQMNGQELVRVETLNDYCSSRLVNAIDLLKIDVEGHELEVLRGAQQLFEGKKIKRVAFEFGGCNIDSRIFLRDFYEFFAAHGMQPARVTAFGALRSMPRYSEALERFRTTCFVATLPPL